MTTVRIQRLDTVDLLKDNPSLKPYLQAELQNFYQRAKALAAGEADLPLQTFPSDCPYRLEEILSDRFYPGESAPDDLIG